jgi:type III pantothenate kinase
MDWLFDLGNTRLKAAPMPSGQNGRPLAGIAAIAHDGVDARRCAALLPARGDVAYLASVAAPALTTGLLDLLAQRFARISMARTQPAFAGVRIAYADPRRLGVDRFLALLAARARGDASLVVAVGTALTIDLLDAHGQHRGGRIAPSPASMRAALHARVAHLPAAGGRYVEFADDTDDALASGCEGAALALVERSCAQAAALLGATPRVLLHGGGAEVLRARFDAGDWVPGLVMEGLQQWALVERDAVATAT